MRDPGHLMALHSRTGPGRRHHEPSLNRAVVVMTTAAWQSYVQDTTQAILDTLSVPPAHTGAPMFNLIKASTRTALGRFNTPNARNTLALFYQVGFDPSGAGASRSGLPRGRTAFRIPLTRSTTGWPSGTRSRTALRCQRSRLSAVARRTGRSFGRRTPSAASSSSPLSSPRLPPRRTASFPSRGFNTA